jgi:hypothetical protein
MERSTMKTSQQTLLLASLLLFSAVASAHCDSLDGPVIRDAITALEKRDAAPVLKWVKSEHEAEIRDAFAKAIAVRGLNGDARQIADRYFFETLVRIHRAGEGEPFTGLKPAGSVEPGIDAADKALEKGSGAALATELAQAVREGVNKRFDATLAHKKHAGDSVEAGRKYVEAYVDYVHFVESVHRLAEHGAPHVHAE